MPIKTAIVAGHICLDIIPELGPGSGERMKPGVLVECGRAALSTGGAVSNVGLALERLGIETRLAGKVGDDLFGRGILDLVRARDESLVLGMKPVGGANSSYSVVISPPGVDRTFLHCPGANDTFGSHDVSDELLSSGDLLHLGYPPIMKRMFERSGAECAKLMSRAKEHELTTTLDMSRPDPDSESGKVNWREWMKNVLPNVDVFLPSVEELAFMLDRARHDELESRSGGLLANIDGALLADLASELLDLGVAVAVVKLGDRGLYLRTTASLERLAAAGSCAPDASTWLDRELYVPCFKADVAGTTGSGDCTIAGFIAAFMRGLSPEETLESAVATGACSVEVPDATGGIRSWEETRERIAAGWEQLDLNPELAGWNSGKPAWTGPNDGGAS